MKKKITGDDYRIETQVGKYIHMKGMKMGEKIEHIHWPDAPDLWMPYAPVIKVTRGSLVFLAGVTAAPVYHHHPHRPEEFDSIPRDMEGQARATLENMKKVLRRLTLILVMSFPPTDL